MELWAVCKLAGSRDSACVHLRCYACVCFCACRNVSACVCVCAHCADAVASGSPYLPDATKLWYGEGRKHGLITHLCLQFFPLFFLEHITLSVRFFMKISI